MSEASERGKLPPDKIYEMYKEDSDFREYVGKYCHDRSVGIFEALAHITVHEVAKYYKTAKKDLIKPEEHKICDAR